MKKLFAILMVLALVSGAAFAQISGAVIANTTLLYTDTTEKADGDSGMYGKGGIEAAKFVLRGDAGEYGGFLRFDPFGGWFGDAAAHAWWKPVDQFLLRLGRDPDGFWGKENVTGWMYNRDGNDTVATQGYGYSTFYGGFSGWGLMLEIKPIDILAINIGLPYFEGTAVTEKKVPWMHDYDYGEDWYWDAPDEAWFETPAGWFPFKVETVSSDQVGDIFKALTLQVDVNLDIVNFALTYVGDSRVDNLTDKKAITMGQLYLNVGLGMISNVDLNIGANFVLPGEEKGQPITVGLGAGVSVTDEFGIRARLQAILGGNADEGQDDTLYLKVGVMPFYAISDNFTAFFNLGVNVASPKEGDAVIGFFVNPYIQVGSEWGPSFWAGLIIQSDGVKDAEDKTVTEIAIPIGVTFSF